MSFAAAPGRPIRSEINVTPLIDVVLVLLIVFMVAVPALLRQLPLSVSSPEGAPPAASSTRPVAVHIAADERVLLDGEPVRVEELGERARAALRRDPSGLVLFEVEDGASYALMMRAMDSCRGAGARTLGLPLAARR